MPGLWPGPVSNKLGAGGLGNYGDIIICWPGPGYLFSITPGCHVPDVARVFLLRQNLNSNQFIPSSLWPGWAGSPVRPSPSAKIGMNPTVNGHLSFFQSPDNFAFAEMFLMIQLWSYLYNFRHLLYHHNSLHILHNNRRGPDKQKEFLINYADARVKARTNRNGRNRENVSI